MMPNDIDGGSTGTPIAGLIDEVKVEHGNQPVSLSRTTLVSELTSVISEANQSGISIDGAGDVVSESNAEIEIVKPDSGRDHFLSEIYKYATDPKANLRMDKRAEAENLVRMISQAINSMSHPTASTSFAKTIPKPLITKDELEQNAAHLELGTGPLVHYTSFHRLLDAHRTPFVFDIDYADSWLSEEIEMLKKEPAMTQVAVYLETQNSTRDHSSLKECPVCESPSILTCKNCLGVAYCSREHQKMHWKTHRPHCQLYEMAVNELLGRHFVAKSNIKPGDLILKEYPLIVGPSQGDSVLTNLNFNVAEILDSSKEECDISGELTKNEFLDLHRESFNPVCLGCSLELGNIPNPQFCKDCGWPLCQSDCFEIKNHKMECNFFQKQGISYWECSKQYILPARVYVVLRFLLIKTAKPLIWDKLMNLQSHIKERLREEREYGTRMNDLYLVFLIKKVFRFSSVPAEEIQMILGIMDTNGFYAARADNSVNFDNVFSRTRKHISLYDKGSLFSHSCAPNAIAIRHDPPALEVVAAMPIKKGEIIWIDYDYQGFLRPKCERLQLLKVQYFFDCSCPLCTDATENNQYMSGISCGRCRRKHNEGYFLPMDPLSDDTMWKCRRCSCKKSNTAVSKLLRDISNEICRPLVGTRSLRTVVDNIEGLHKNHSMILQAESDIMRMIYTHMCKRANEVSVSDLQYLTSLIDKRIGIVQQLAPPCHKSLINLKLQLVEVMTAQAIRFDQSYEAVGFPFSVKIQAIHDDILSLLTEQGVRTSMQAFLLCCSRLVRNKLHQVHGQLHRHRTLLERTIRLPSRQSNLSS